MIVRQGDVLLEKVRSVPKSAEKQERDGDVILELGESTGHAHRIRHDGVHMFLDAGQQFLRIKDPVSLTHEEHAPIELPTGVYRRAYQVEEKREAITRVSD